MDIEELKKKLRTYKKEDIIIKYHAELQAFIRRVDLEKVKENILNPFRLVYAEKQKSKFPNEEKYNCYFAYSKNHYHRYVIIINRKIIIATIIDINRDWQKTIG